MNEVAYQDEVVAVLQKSIQGADVRDECLMYPTLTWCHVIGAQPVILWPSWYREDLSHPGSV